MGIFDQVVRDVFQRSLMKGEERPSFVRIVRTPGDEAFIVGVPDIYTMSGAMQGRRLVLPLHYMLRQRE